MSVLSIEIGGQTVRAMLRTQQGMPVAVELGDLAGQYCIPSAFAKDAEGRVHVGNDALRRKYHSEFNNIQTLENDKQAFAKGMQSLLDLAIRKATMQCGEKVVRIAVVVPCHYGNNDPRKSTIKDAASKLGVYDVDFVPVHEALCLRQAYIDDAKYVMVFDMGHLGTQISLLQRRGPKFVVTSSQRMNGVGGFAFAGLIYRDIKEKCAPSMPEDIMSVALANDELERIAMFVKERLSVDESCSCPIPFSGKSYSISRKEFDDKLSSSLSPVYTACQKMANENGISTADISEVLFWGGSCRIPFVIDRCKYLFKQINPSIRMTNCASMPGSVFLACEGGLRNNNSSVTLTL